jgi:DNA polymerase-1
MMKNPFVLWERTHIDGVNGLFEIRRRFGFDKPLTGGFDTETTGLHIIKDKPFLIQFGWLVPKKDFGRVYTFYPTPENMKMFFELAKRFKYFLAHNIKYDLHMLSNIGYAAEVQAMTNLYDTTAIARLALEAIPEREGGDSLRLKKLGEKYVHPEAGKSESIIKDELRKLKADGVKVLSAALKQFDHPEDMEYKVFRLDNGKKTTSVYDKNNPGKAIWKWVPAKWNKKRITDWMKDPTLDIDLLPDDVREVWTDWQEEYPEPTYEDVDRDIMLQYGAEDIITMLEFFKHAFPYIKKREQLAILEMESKCILPMYRMERVGLKADLTYLEESRQKVKNYIIKLRNEMYEIIGEKITVNQHQKIKAVYLSKWNIPMESDDAAALKKIIDPKFTCAAEAKRLSILIKAIRSLEKWYTTYIKPIIKNAAYDGKAYTQINSSGAVSGRMSSNFQQFPKKPLKTEEGEELFHPRKAFIVKGGNYESIAYIDYDQIELVTQAHYTLLVSGGDLNLCRAYMPFKCKHYRTNHLFDYRTAKGRAAWDEKQPNGESAWLDEEGKPWVKTDLHAMTAHKAYPHIPMDTEDFVENYRPKGKTTNFAANYGGGPAALTGVLGISWEEAEQLVNGYNEAFPGVIAYQKKIIRAHSQKGYVQNHYGRRYYIQDSYRAYKLANYVVQGTAADAIKQAIIEIDQFLADKKSKMVIPIHDEIQFDLYKGEEWIIPELRKIMEKAFHWSLVPVTAGVEITYDAWANKKRGLIAN